MTRSIAFLVSGFVLLAVVFAFGANREASPGRVVVQELLLVDAGGQERARLRTVEGRPVLEFLDDRGVSCASVSIDAQNSPVLEMTGDRGSKLRIAVDQSAPKILLVAPVTPAGHKGMEISITASNQAIEMVFDHAPAGRSIWLGMTPFGPALQMFSPKVSGATGVLIAGSPDGGMLGLYNEDGSQVNEWKFIGGAN